MGLQWYEARILNFSWNPPHTRFSSPLFLTVSIGTYLSLTLALSLVGLPAFPRRVVKGMSAVHNLILLLLSLVMGLGCGLSLVTHTPDLRWAVCFPQGTPPRGPLFFWAYMFYLSKILEFLDTLFIVVSGSMRRLSFLHVYHHATVVLMCYIWLNTSQSLFPIALLTNASVHVIMYSYYFLCAIGIRPSWKRALTNCQILQFLFSFAVSLLMLHFHFSSPSGCSGISGWCFNALFNASLFALFLNFHRKSYAHNIKHS
ncbi:hypothetical protein VNO78_03517 [Psophocarpus tetragonolobus]|uniref:very-long-chain 3-oxoacyl-CoA synthase n=1 Tax=Psophocarpus tetragonolobus TaxID=3891 RepID=A0AAN9T0N8_PSOTE